MHFTFAFLITLAANLAFAFELRCKNEVSGKNLDWFTLYKMPKLGVKSANVNVKNGHLLMNGTAYMFMSNQATEFRLSDLSMNDSQSLVAKTLEPLYANSSIGYILYNDQADKVSVSRGHTKGVLLFDEKNLVWLVHSIPHFPPTKSENQYYIRSSQCIFGQSMLCLSLSIDHLGTIAKQLMYNYPQVYDYFIPETLKNSNSVQILVDVINGKHVKSEPWSSLEPLSTLDGEKMLSFAKFNLFNEDLYSGLVAPHLNSSLLTETWNNGVGTLKSNCSIDFKYHVINVENIKFALHDIKFSVHKDHSKFAVTSPLNANSKKILCIGDINRQTEQFKRGGGTVCFLNNEKVWSEYHKIIDSIETCGNTKLKTKMNAYFRKAKSFYNFIRRKISCTFSNEC